MMGGGGTLQPVKGHVSVENARVPFVFDGLAHGLKRFFVPVVTPADGKGVFTVRLGFAALPGDKLGQRVFDVKINGKKVLTSFDIMKEARRPDRAVWKEFNVTLGQSLTVEMVPKFDKLSVDGLPLINGLQVLRR